MLWLAGLGVHEAVDVAAHISSATLLRYLGITWGAQRLVLTARARNPGRLPTVPPDPAAR